MGLSDGSTVVATTASSSILCAADASDDAGQQRLAGQPQQHLSRQPRAAGVRLDERDDLTRRSVHFPLVLRGIVRHRP